MKSRYPSARSANTHLEQIAHGEKMNAHAALAVANKVGGVWLAIASIWLTLQVMTPYVATNGGIGGSEFGMLIALLNQAGAAMLWLTAVGLGSD